MRSKDKVTVLFFAQLSEISHQTEAQYPIEAQETALSLYQRICAEYDFPLEATQLRAARNHAFCPWDTVLENRDIVAFIPPVAGG